MDKNLGSNSVKEKQVNRKCGREYCHSTYKRSTFYVLLLAAFLLPSLNFFAQDSIVVKGRFINNIKYAKVLMGMVFMPQGLVPII